MAAFEAAKREKQGIASAIEEVVGAIRHMPRTMRRCALVQVLTWLGLSVCGFILEWPLRLEFFSENRFQAGPKQIKVIKQTE